MTVLSSSPVIRSLFELRLSELISFRLIHLFLNSFYLLCVRSFVCCDHSFVRSCVCSFVRLCVGPFVRSCACSFVRLCVGPFVCVFVRSFVRSCMCSFIRSFMRPCVRASVRPCVRASVRPCVRACVRACVRSFTGLFIRFLFLPVYFRFCLLFRIVMFSLSFFFLEGAGGGGFLCVF